MTDAELAEARLSAWRDAERENTELHAKIARLRAENKRLRGEAGGMEMEIFDLRAQMEQLGADMAELARVRAALNAQALDLVPALRMMQAIAEERAAVVKYLAARGGICVDLADDIERGEHRHEGEP